MRDSREGEDLQVYLNDIFGALIRHVKKGAKDTDLVGVTVQKSSPDQKPVQLSLRKPHQLDVSVLLAQIERVVQSNKLFLVNASLNVKITRVDMPVGIKNDEKRDYILNYDNFCAFKQSIVVIRNTNDAPCLPRALITAVQLLKTRVNDLTQKNANTSFYKQLCTGSSSTSPDLQLTEALKLCQAAGIDPASITGSLEDVHRFQNHLREYKITVFARCDCKDALYEGPEIESNQFIDLFYYSRHFNIIRSLTGLTESSYFCRECKIPYDHTYVHEHRCAIQCNRCYRKQVCFIHFGSSSKM